MKSIVLVSFLAVFFGGVAQINPRDNCPTGLSNVLTVGSSCSVNNYSLPGTYNNGGLVSATCATPGNNRDDGWFSFVATSSNVVITETADRDRAVSVWTSCGGGSELGCAYQTSGNTLSLTVSTLTAGTTYYVQIHRRSGTNTSDQTGTICLVAPISNNTPCTATSLVVGTTCSTISGTTASASSSGIPAPSPGCASMGSNQEDVWYSIVVPAIANGALSFEASNLSNSGGMAIYRGTCASPVYISCTASSTSPTIQTTGLITGEIIYIRMWRNNSNNDLTFDICVHTLDCSANTTNDFCEDAATLTMNASAIFGSATAALYTYDNPGGVESVFCGTIQNNSWYAFVATSSTAVFPITSVTGCTQGIQAQVYSFDTSSGCCLNPVAMSNCYNPGNTTLATVTATGLTTGNTYYLMIDGWNGANCDFTISGWSATGVLPIKLMEFTGVAESRMNRLNWRTASEINSDVIVVEKSEDGKTFKAIGSVKGGGNSTTTINYSFEDYELYPTLAYYRLKQIDFDGKFEYSKTISVIREGKVELYPNPTNGDITVKFADPIAEDWTITFTDLFGRNVTSSVERINASSDQLVFSTDALRKGYYFVKVLNGSGEQIFNNSFIKE